MRKNEQETPMPERPRVTVWPLVFLASVLGLFFMIQNVETKGVRADAGRVVVRIP